jgi:hypothetical protein
VLAVTAASALAFRTSSFTVRSTASGLVYKVSVCGLAGVHTKIVAAIRLASSRTISDHTWHVVPHFSCTRLKLRASDPFPPGTYVTTLGVFARHSHVILPAKRFQNL